MCLEGLDRCVVVVEPTLAKILYCNATATWGNCFLYVVFSHSLGRVTIQLLRELYLQKTIHEWVLTWPPGVQ